MDELICLDAKKGDPLTAALLLAEMAVDPFRTGPVKSHVFLIVSGKDRVLSRRSMKRLRQDLGGCPWVSYPQIGHTPVLEAFEHLAGDIRKIAGS